MFLFVKMFMKKHGNIPLYRKRFTFEDDFMDFGKTAKWINIRISSAHIHSFQGQETP